MPRAKQEIDSMITTEVVNFSGFLYIKFKNDYYFILSEITLVFVQIYLNVTHYTVIKMTDTLHPVMIVSTYPDTNAISEIASKVIGSKLAACVNISNIRSFYLWEDKIMTDEQEQIAIFKTTSDRKTQLKEMIRQTHPYDVPEIAEISISDINKSYMNWLVSSTRM